MLRAIHGPFPQAKFCPTGGINETNFADYLMLPNVSCVGGSWVIPEEAIKMKIGRSLRIYAFLYVRV